MEVKCWNCEEEIDEEEKVRKIEGNRVCDDCWENHLEELAIDNEPDYPDTVREQFSRFGGQ